MKNCGPFSAALVGTLTTEWREGTVEHFIKDDERRDELVLRANPSNRSDQSVSRKQPRVRNAPLIL